MRNKENNEIIEKEEAKIDNTLDEIIKMNRVN
jgi:hypothetical protein